MVDMVMTNNLLQLDHSSLMALACVVIIGLPHGAFDGAIAQHLGYGRGWRSLTSFIGLYIGLAAVVVAFWIWQPGLSLVLFLLLSALHFGFGDSTATASVSRAVQIIAHGGVAVFGISLFHLNQVVPLFAALTNGDVVLALLMIELFPLLMIPVAGLYLFFAIRDAALRPRLVELALLCLLLSILSPLVGFAIYFCVIHTGRHMQHIWRRVRACANPRHILGEAALFTVLSWVGGGIILLWLDSGNFSQDLLQVIFIGLAALTVPHVILVDGMFRLSDAKDCL
jgi:Brp/Blh family beta-carotene 15,15'-monooxygenase